MKNKSDAIICVSKDKDRLTDIKNIFEFANLNEFKPEYFVKDNIIHISIYKIALELKNIKVEQYYKIINETIGNK